MATILLSAAGAAIGSGFGGTVLGLSGAVIGRAVGATLGRALDQRLLGAGSEPVETGKVERFRLTGASEGAEIAQAFGRVRLAGQVIWASRFLESTSSSGGGKGAPRPRVTSYSYSVSFAVALCEGVISSVGHIWADGTEIDRTTLNYRVYDGSEDQLPDPKIVVIEGEAHAPAYRGIAYVIFEDLDLGPFGNRVPQFTFEVIRPAQGTLAEETGRLDKAIRAVALMPGTGEFSLATTPLHFKDGPGLTRPVNINTPSGKPDFETSLDALTGELPEVGSVSLIVSWFGSDLKCADCRIKPKVDQKLEDPVGMSWSVNGVTRDSAEEVALAEGRPVYGGTPTDASVIEAIAALHGAGQEVMFYPFILMEQLAGNALGDPWTGAVDQPLLPWRGRITLSAAPGREGSPDGTAAAEAEVAAFFGTARPEEFAINGTSVSYTGTDGWSYRRFILHYAHLCAAAGGVDAFCIGSEMRSLTQIRGAEHGFPAVTALRALAGDVRAILGPETKISYAADWSEYFGYHADGNIYFHLDPLWADTNIDFIGIDNYMPLSDWRDEEDHADAGWGSIYNRNYLKANILGGEGYDWYYDSPEGEADQLRLPINDDSYGEDWIYRYKDIPGWWSNLHFNRIDGDRAAVPTAWIPQSKPVWFTEYGCAAIDRGTNQPNRFLDPKSSEGGLPKYSTGRRDEIVPIQYLRAMAEFWGDEANNPVSAIYGASMLDMTHAHVWAWDARPFPAFPNRDDLWTDGENYARGHWLTGRSATQPLDTVVAEICERAGLTDIDVSGLYGAVRGAMPPGVGSGRAALQPLLLAYGVDAIEREGVLTFRNRGGQGTTVLSPAELAEAEEIGGAIERTRASEAETAGRVRLAFVEADGDFAIREVETSFPDDDAVTITRSELALGLNDAEALNIAERWLAEARVARDTLRLALPPSLARIGAGDVIRVDNATYRVDRLDQDGAALAEATRIEPALYVPAEERETVRRGRIHVSPSVHFPLFLDLPIIRGTEVPHAPHVAVAASPWPGAAAVWKGLNDESYSLNRLVPSSAMVGVTLSPMRRARAGMWDRGAPLRVRMSTGSLSSVSDQELFNGANLMMIGDGSPENWELFQFARADLLAARTYDLSQRLRGQLGSDAVMPEIWPEGSFVVLYNDALLQIDLDASERGLARHYRVGNAVRGDEDPDVIHRIEAFKGVGLRCYFPAHLRAEADGEGMVHASWIRRTRIDGDSWESFDVPLGEERERYLVRVVREGSIRREATVETAAWSYPLSQQVSDATQDGFELHVAQISDRAGPGAFATLTV
ncbi:MAG: glycoside hydrolase TIM-barrel-like domain-containing protein [Pseudorhodobacter sp.]